MKKTLSAILSAALTAGILTAAVSADELSAQIYVTIADENGKLAVVNEAIEVTDVNGDGKLTIEEALYCAHEEKFTGDTAGFETGVGDYGTYINTLWGVSNGGSYGYYVNNTAAMSLDDEVKDGDMVYAFIYTDLTTWSDTYCYFDTTEVSAEVGEAVVLTLTAAAYDENYAPITVPVENARITLNGEETEFVTDSEGKVVITVNDAANYVISAISNEKILVPPVCKAEISAAAADNTPSEEDTASDVSAETEDKGSPDTGAADVAAFGGLALVCALGVICSKKR